MASSQAVAKFFIYLVLSGHAHAFRIKRSLRPKEQSQTQAFPGTSPPTAEEKAEDEFYAKVKTFSTDPLMQLFGSGGQLSTFWLGLTEENKQLSLDALQDDVNDMFLGNATRPNAVVELEEGFNRWFEKRQKKHPDQTKYKNCGFSFAPLIPDMRRDIGPDELAKVAPAAFVNVNQTEKPCEFGTTFNQTLAKHMELANHAIKFANWFVGKGKSNSSKEGTEQDFQNLEPSLTQATALLEVKPANMQDRPFDPLGLGLARYPLSASLLYLLVILDVIALIVAMGGPGANMQDLAVAMGGPANCYGPGCHNAFDPLGLVVAMSGYEIPPNWYLLVILNVVALIWQEIWIIRMRRRGVVHREVDMDHIMDHIPPRHSSSSNSSEHGSNSSETQL